ncbi:MAG: hypothetical protein PVJ04_05985, partial [Gemmatimonadota bacterium]
MHSAIRLPAPSLVALIFPALILIPGALSAQSTGVARAAASITEEDFYNRVEVIAHDSMMGRDTPSPGLDKTARWVGDEFRRFGLKPGGDDGSFLQEYVIQMVAPDLENSVIRVSGGGELAFGRDVIAALGTPAEEEVAGGVVLLAGGALPEGIGEEEMRGRHLILLLPEDTAGQSRRAQMQMLNDIVAAEPVSIMLVNRQSDADWNQAAALQGQRTQP